MNLIPKKLHTLAICLFLFAFTFHLSALTKQAEAGQASEYEVKAAFLYNFAKFVEWPESTTDNTLNICTLGEDPFDKAMDSIVGRFIKKRRVVIKRISSVKKSENCHILFVSSSERKQLRAITQAIGDAAILTIGDTEGFAKKGLIINLIMENDKVRFEVNLDAAKRSGLHISSSLLELARIIREGP